MRKSFQASATLSEDSANGDRMRTSCRANSAARPYTARPLIGGAPESIERPLDRRRRHRTADDPLHRPMIARADCLDPRRGMQVARAVLALEPERVQRIPKPSVDQLEPGELGRRQHAG